MRTTINNQYDILSSTANGIFLQNQYFNKQAASENNIGYKIIPEGFVTYRSMSDTGEFHFNLQNLVRFGIISPAYPVFDINNINVNKDFFVYYINENNDFKRKLLSNKEGGTRYSLNIHKFESIIVSLPSKVEQDELAKIIMTIKKLLDREEYKLQILIKMKKGFIQSLFV